MSLRSASRSCTPANARAATYAPSLQRRQSFLSSSLPCALPPLLLCLSTAELYTKHMLIDFVRAIDAFTHFMSVPNGAAQFYEAINTPLSLAKTATYVTVTLVLDALIVYRTYVVWGRSLVVVFLPSMLFVADIALSAWATHSITEVHGEADIMLANVTLRVKYFYAVTLALNLFCTCMSIIVRWMSVAFTHWLYSGDCRTYLVRPPCRRQSFGLRRTLHGRHRRCPRVRYVQTNCAIDTCSSFSTSQPRSTLSCSSSSLSQARSGAQRCSSS